MDSWLNSHDERFTEVEPGQGALKQTAIFLVVIS
jgi:hypothetical protein